MQKRTSHNKSRRGCLSCKKRHVKCDEQGPPCANCVIRKTSCVYPNSPNSGTTADKKRSKRAALVARIPKDEYSNDLDDWTQSCGRTTSDGCSTQSQGSSPGLSICSPSSVIFPTSPESHRLLELELMHHWTARTWMGLYSVPEDQEYLQVYMPRTALKTSYIMNGLLAITAVDMARNVQGSESSVYLCAALEYSNKASADFRRQLSDINHENLHLLFYFAMVAAIFNFTISAKHSTTMDRTFMIFDMTIGAFDIACVNAQWLLDSPSSVSSLINYEFARPEDIDPDSRLALDRLESVSSQMCVPTANAKDQLQHAAGEESHLASDVYRLPLAQLKYCFAEDARCLIKGYCLAFITATGRSFAAAIRKQEPMSLFILIHFGVLLDRAAGDGVMWWLTSAGRDLVGELSEILLQSPIAQIPEGYESISWAREQVGLSALSLRVEGLAARFEAT